MEDKSVSTFREYIRIKTVQPNPNYGKHNQSNKVNIKKNLNYKICFQMSQLHSLQKSSKKSDWNTESFLRFQINPFWLPPG